MAQGKYWVFTNFKSLDIDYNEWNDMTYLCYGLETCPTTGRLHHQGYVEFSKNKRLSALKKLDNTISWRLRKGTQDQAINYTKGGEEYDKPINEVWIEIGTKKIDKQGKRNDIDKLKNEILDGKSVEDITIENPIMYHQYGRTLEKIEMIRMKRNERNEETEMPNCIWYYGPTGSGKSHRAFKGYSRATHFKVNNDALSKGWWDGYEQQGTVILNEYRGGLKYSFLLELMDKWAVDVPLRQKGGIPFNSHTIIITSSMSPEECYHNLAENDTLDQLYRRCKVIQIGTDGIEVVRGNTGPDQSQKDELVYGMSFA